MRSRRAVVTVVVDPVNDAGYISGQPARGLVAEVGGRLLWSPRRRAYCTSQAVAGDVLALADARHFGLVYERLDGAG